MSSLPKTEPAIEFKSRFVLIGPELVAQIARQFGSPLFLIDLPGLENRFREFQTAVLSRYPGSRVAISYKTNPTMALLRMLHRLTAVAEVVSKTEFQLARCLGIPENKIIFNGPAKDNADLASALRGGSQINCDHLDEIDRIEKIASSLNMVAPIGIRLTPPVESYFSRFGFSVTHPLEKSEAFQTAIRIDSSPHLSFAGIHSQLGTDIRNIEKFNQQGRYMAEFANFVREKLSIELQWINVGGGLAGIAPRKNCEDCLPSLPCVETYAAAIIEPLHDYLESCARSPALYFEPGRTIFEPFGGLLTTVLGRRPPGRSGTAGIICDAGICSLALASRYDFPIHFCRQEIPSDRFDFFGPTCMQRDQIANDQLAPDLKIGDHMIFYGVGGYGLSFASSFINPRPGIVGWSETGEFDWLRKPETLEYSQLLQQPDDQAKIRTEST